jgi:hypothetical protein
MNKPQMAWSCGRIVATDDETLAAVLPQTTKQKSFQTKYA